jgi:hypothetical protein
MPILPLLLLQRAQRQEKTPIPVQKARDEAESWAPCRNGE